MTGPLHQWDVVKTRIRPEDRDEHFAVVLSREEICQSEHLRQVNVLFGTSKRPAESAGELEVILNGADGLERQTLFNCGQIYRIEKLRISVVAGSVTLARRRAFGRKIVHSFRLPL